MFNSNVLTLLKVLTVASDGELRLVSSSASQDVCFVQSRLAMLGVTSALAAEFATGVGIKQQVTQEPVGILAAFIIISLASYIPIARGFTRKEPFSNAVFNPQVGIVLRHVGCSHCASNLHCSSQAEIILAAVLAIPAEMRVHEVEFKASSGLS